MSLTDLNILCDENLPKIVTVALRDAGYQVKKVVPGASDTVIATKAKQEKCILVTFDSDFANILVYPPQKFYGIVHINIHPQLYETVIAALKNLFAIFRKPADFKGKLIILEATTFRIWDNKMK